jgi:hypothetical protein
MDQRVKPDDDDLTVPANAYLDRFALSSRASQPKLRAEATSQ